MDLDFVKQMNDIKKTKDDAITIAEHSAILLHYKQTGHLERSDAIKKYKEFNDNHPEYYLAMKTVATQNGTAVQIDDKDIPDEVIIGNLNQQLLYLTGKNLLEELKHDQPTP